MTELLDLRRLRQAILRATGHPHPEDGHQPDECPTGVCEILDELDAHMAVEVKLRDLKPDANCVTTPDGGCVGSDCMHSIPYPRRDKVDYRYDAIHPEFLKLLARIAAYADAKYVSWVQYMRSRLTGDKAPLNHLKEHLRAYEMGERYDHFDGDPRWHLAAVAYNAMMEWWYHTRFGHAPHPSARSET